jgi:hypothetical protein
MHTAQGRMKSKIIVSFEYMVRSDAKRWAGFIVLIVGMRYYRIKSVIAASQLNNDKYALRTTLLIVQHRAPPHRNQPNLTLHGIAGRISDRNSRSPNNP